MERAFVNVLENARRHSGGHPVSVRARAVRSLAGARRPAAAEDGAGEASSRCSPVRPGDRVIVRVVDRGPGIPPAQLERVFEPFYRAGTATRRTPGLGPGPRDRPRLCRGERGLAACRVAARTGGDVRVRASAQESGQALENGAAPAPAGRGGRAPRPEGTCRPREPAGARLLPPRRRACSWSTTSRRSCAR